MQKKLTLRIDQQVVEQAKRYAKHRQRSIFRMVEDYLRKISTAEIDSTTEVSTGILGNFLYSFAYNFQVPDAGMLSACVMNKCRVVHSSSEISNISKAVPQPL